MMTETTIPAIPSTAPPLADDILACRWTTAGIYARGWHEGPGGYAFFDHDRLLALIWRADVPRWQWSTLRGELGGGKELEQQMLMCLSRMRRPGLNTTRPITSEAMQMESEKLLLRWQTSKLRVASTTSKELK